MKASTQVKGRPIATIEADSESSDWGMLPQRREIFLFLVRSSLLLFLVTILACSRANSTSLRLARQVSHTERTTTMTLSPAQGQSYIVSWNAWSRQFIDPPEFRLLAVPGLQAYRALVAQDGKTWRVQSPHPLLSLDPCWREMAPSTFTLTFEWIDSQGKIAGQETSMRVKAPDWAGFHEKPEDWAAAGDRNMAYLINTAWNGSSPYKEPGEPIIMWSIASPTNANSAGHLPPGNWNLPNGFGLSYPANALGTYLPAFVASASRGGPLAAESLRLARACADWALKHRLPDDGALPLFPYSTVNEGKAGGGVEGKSTYAMRASLMAAGLVNVFEATRETAYLDYARHIADTLMKLQRPEGSFPYRINPATGDVVDPYAPDAVDFALLVDALEPHGFDRKRRMAAQRAIDWMLYYVCATNHWQGAYEDIGHLPPFRNLTQRQCVSTIRYLCRHKDENPAYLPAARKLSRWMEDQFIIFGSDSKVFARSVKPPMVCEQFACWFPGEGHTGYWILALIDLHRATGEREYLDKAMAAGNAVCATQFDTGAFSTWGMRHYENGRIVPDKDPGFNWYNCNARADWGLYALDSYVRSLK